MVFGEKPAKEEKSTAVFISAVLIKSIIENSLLRRCEDIHVALVFSKVVGDCAA